MINETNKEILLKTVKEFVSDCGIDYYKEINQIWPSEEFLTVHAREVYRFNYEVHIFDYLGTGKNINLYKIICESTRKKTGHADLNATFYNMNGEQLEKSFAFIEKLLNNYGLSIHQELSSQEKYNLQMELYNNKKDNSIKSTKRIKRKKS